SSAAVLVFVGIFGLMLLGTVITILVWYFNRKPGAYEMMVYLPEDCQSAAGVNISHLQKYPKLWDALDKATGGAGFHLAGEAVGGTTGSKANDILDYVVYGEAKGGGGTLILRLKEDVSTPELSKLPGAQERKTPGGSKYYEVDHYD